MTDAEFADIAGLIHEKTGIYYPERKKYLIENRLKRRLDKLSLKSFAQYAKALRTNNGPSGEMQNFINAVTTNETSFFRNPPQLRAFMETVLPEIIKSNKEKKKKTIRVWSAASSSGEEVYTLATMISESRLVPLGWKVELLATDINTEVLGYARNGVYSKYPVRNVPKEIMEKYFDVSGEEYKIKPQLLPPIRFEIVNLMEQRRHLYLEDFDVVCCCNVLMYFSNEVKRKVVADIFGAINAPGFLFIGHAESLHNISKDFKLVNIKGTPIYKK